MRWKLDVVGCGCGSVEVLGEEMAAGEGRDDDAVVGCCYDGRMMVG